MGDRYELIKACAYCGEVNEDIWYAPTCGSFTFDCEKCSKENFINTDFEVKKMSDVTYDDVYWAVNNASNMMDEKQIEECAKDYWKAIQKQVKKKKEKIK